MPPQNPLTRIQQVARDLARLGEEIEPYIGSDAKTALLHWRDELLSAVDELQQRG